MIKRKNKIQFYAYQDLLMFFYYLLLDYRLVNLFQFNYFLNK